MWPMKRLGQGSRWKENDGSFYPRKRKFGCLLRAVCAGSPHDSLQSRLLCSTWSGPRSGGSVFSPH